MGVIPDQGVLLAAIRDTLKEESKKEIQDTKDATFPLTTAIIGFLRMGSWQLMGPLVPPVFHAPTRRVLGISPEKEKWLQVPVTVTVTRAFDAVSRGVVAVGTEFLDQHVTSQLFLWIGHTLLCSRFPQALFGHFFKGLIDHLVVNHRQLLSMERENHKVQCPRPRISIPSPASSYLFSSSLTVPVHPSLRLTAARRCFSPAGSCTRTLSRDMMRRASATGARAIALEWHLAIAVFIFMFRYFEKLKDICTQVPRYSMLFSCNFVVASHFLLFLQAWRNYWATDTRA